MTTLLAAARITMTSILTIAALGAVATAAPQKVAAKKPDIGESFDLFKARRAALPNADVEVAQKPSAVTVTDRQVADKVNDRFAELEYCWLRVPAAQQVSTTAILHLAIDADGLVSSAKMIGELPAGVGKCMTTMASHWRFAVTGNACELEHAFSLNAK